MMNKKSAGFTLIELMIVVAVVAILASIALPAYQDSVRKSRRADVMTKLLNIQLEEEKWRANNTKYAVTSASIGNPASDYYTFSIVASTNVYTAVAIPISTKGQTKDKQYGTDCGFGIYIDQSGKGHYTATPVTSSTTAAQSNKMSSSECWRK